MPLLLSGATELTSSSLSLSPRLVAVYVGEGVRFNCTLDSSDPSANFSWTRNDEVLGEEFVEPLPSGSSLRLGDIPLSWDCSTIKCEAAAGGEMLVAMATLEVHCKWCGGRVMAGREHSLTPPFLPLSLPPSLPPAAMTPVIVTPPSGLTVELGESFSLDCVVRGSPTPTVSWSHGSLGLLDPSLLPELTISDSKLTVSSTREDYAGEYRCTARNEHGVVHASATVSVPGESEREK